MEKSENKNGFLMQPHMCKIAEMLPSPLGGILSMAIINYGKNDIEPDFGSEMLPRIKITPAFLLEVAFEGCRPALDFSRSHRRPGNDNAKKSAPNADQTQKNADQTQKNADQTQKNADQTQKNADKTQKNADKTQKNADNTPMKRTLIQEEKEEEKEEEKIKNNPKRKPSDEGKRKGAAFLYWTIDDFKKEAERAAAERPEYRPYLEAFVDYWTAEHRGGKPLFQTKDAFSMPGRLATWKRNQEQRSGNQYRGTDKTKKSANWQMLKFQLTNCNSTVKETIEALQKQDHLSYDKAREEVAEMLDIPVEGLDSIIKEGQEPLSAPAKSPVKIYQTELEQAAEKLSHPFDPTATLCSEEQEDKKHKND